MRIVSLCSIIALSAAILGGQTAGPETPGFDTAWIDRGADPCVDFYQYACGHWLAKHPVPPDQSRWSRFNELQERNQVILRQVLEVSAATGSQRDPIGQKIGDYYASCMDEEAINKQGLAPLKPELDRIFALSDKRALPGLVARLHRQGVSVLFGFGAQPDYKNSS